MSYLPQGSAKRQKIIDDILQRRRTRKRNGEGSTGERVGNTARGRIVQGHGDEVDVSQNVQESDNAEDDVENYFQELWDSGDGHI